MRSKVTVGVLSIMIVACSLSVGGCSGSGTESTTELYRNDIGQPSNNSKSYTISENSQTDIALGDPPLPNGEPTILIGLDGEPILTSEIAEVYDIHGDPTTTDQITPENDGAEIVCEGFQYFREPVDAACDNYNNPELFKDMEFIGEKTENKNEWKRVNVGDEICGLKLIKATTGFLISQSVYEYTGSYYCSDLRYIDQFVAQFEGTVTIEGFMSSSPRNSYEPDGGSLRFTPVEDKLPIIGKYFGHETDFDIMTACDAHQLLSLNESGQIGIDEPKCDIGDLGIGDVMYVRATLSNIRYYGVYATAELEDMEILSDVLVHIDDYI